MIFVLPSKIPLYCYTLHVPVNRKYFLPENMVLQNSSEVFTSLWPSSQNSKVLLLLTLPVLPAMGQQTAVNARLFAFSCLHSLKINLPYLKSKSLCLLSHVESLFPAKPVRLLKGHSGKRWNLRHIMIFQHNSKEHLSSLHHTEGMLMHVDWLGQ